MDLTKKIKADKWKESKDYIEQNKSMLGSTNVKHFKTLCNAISAPETITKTEIEKALSALKNRAGVVVDKQFKDHLRNFCSNSEIIYREPEEYKTILVELGYIKPKSTSKKVNTGKEQTKTKQQTTPSNPKQETVKHVSLLNEKQERTDFIDKANRLLESKTFWKWTSVVVVALVVVIIVIDKFDDWTSHDKVVINNTEKKSEQQSSASAKQTKTANPILVPTPVISYHTIRGKRYYQWDEENIYKVDIVFRCPNDIEGVPLIPLWEDWLHDYQLRNDVRSVADDYARENGYSQSVDHNSLIQQICQSPDYINGLLLHGITSNLFGEDLENPTQEQIENAANGSLIVREHIYFPHQLLGLKQTVTFSGEVDGVTLTATRYIYYDIHYQRTLTHSDIFTISKRELANRLQTQFIDQYNGSIQINWDAFCANPNLQVELNKDKAVMNLSAFATAYDGEAPIDDAQPSVLIELPYKDSPELWANAVKRIFLNQ